MADVMIDSAGHQLGGLLERQQGRIAFTGCSRFAACPQMVDSISERDKRNEQQNPRDDLIPRERFVKPEFYIEQK